MYKMIRSIVLLLSCLFALVSVVSCQTSAREVDKARAEFYEALQEAVQELALLPEAEIESTFADLLESLGDDRKAVEFVQNIMDEVKLEAMVSSAIHNDADSGDEKIVFDDIIDIDEKKKADTQGDIASDLKELDEMVEEFSAMTEEAREFAFSQLIKALGDHDKTEMVAYVEAIREYIEEKNADKMPYDEKSAPLLSPGLSDDNIETEQDHELDLDFEEDTGDAAPEQLNQSPPKSTDDNNSETDIDGEADLDFEEDQNAGDRAEFDFEIFEDEDENTDNNEGSSNDAVGEMDEEAVQQALHETMKKYYAMPKKEREESFAKVIQMLGDDTKVINQLKELMKEYEEKEQSAETQEGEVHEGDVLSAEAKDEFNNAMQELVDEFVLMPEEEREERFAEILENLGDNAEAVAYVQQLMELVRDTREFLTMTDEEREDRFANIIESLGDDTEAIEYVQSLMETVRNKKISMETLLSSANDGNEGSDNLKVVDDNDNVSDEELSDDNDVVSDDELLDYIRKLDEMEEQLVKAQAIAKAGKAEMMEDIEKGLREVRRAKTQYSDMFRQAEERKEAEKAAKTVRNLLSSSDWTTVYEQRDHILGLTRKSGRLSPKELSLFENDPGAWAKELSAVWKEQQIKVKTEL